MTGAARLIGKYRKRPETTEEKQARESKERQIILTTACNYCDFSYTGSLFVGKKKFAKHKCVVEEEAA